MFIQVSQKAVVSWSLSSLSFLPFFWNFVLSVFPLSHTPDSWRSSANCLTSQLPPRIYKPHKTVSKYFPLSSSMPSPATTSEANVCPSSTVKKQILLQTVNLYGHIFLPMQLMFCQRKQTSPFATFLPTHKRDITRNAAQKQKCKGQNTSAPYRKEVWSFGTCSSKNCHKPLSKIGNLRIKLCQRCHLPKPSYPFSLLTTSNSVVKQKVSGHSMGKPLTNAEGRPTEALGRRFTRR